MYGAKTKFMPNKANLKKTKFGYVCKNKLMPKKALRNKTKFCLS